MNLLNSKWFYNTIYTETRSRCIKWNWGLVHSSMLLELVYRIISLCDPPPPRPPPSKHHVIKARITVRVLEVELDVWNVNIRLPDCPFMSYGTYVTTKTCGFLIDIIRRLVYLRVPLKLFQSDGSFFFLGVCLFFGFGFFFGGGGWGVGGWFCFVLFVWLGFFWEGWGQSRLPSPKCH